MSDVASKCPAINGASRRHTAAGVLSNRHWWPNQLNIQILHQNSPQSDPLGEEFSFKVSAHALKSVEHRGGLDAYLIKARDTDLSLKARRVKRRIEKKRDSAA